MENKFETKDIKHIKNGDVEYLQFKILNKYSDKLKHAITLRHGGVSNNEYESLNFRNSGGDLKENVNQNLEIICNTLDITSYDVVKAKQAHTDNILILNTDNKEKYLFKNYIDEEYDGYIVTEKNIASLITTADCNPVIIYDPIKNIAANIHSGWKGTVQQIYLKAINILHYNFNSNYDDLIVCVGPSIGKCCFDSEEEKFKENFINVWENEKDYLSYEENSKRFHIDLPYLIKNDCMKIGIKEENIVLSNICTMCNSEDFFSYRSNTKAGKKDYGTGATIVELV